MTDDPSVYDYVVVGGGMAGARAVEALARMAGNARIALVCKEPTLPYYRPAVSKEFLSPEGDPGAFSLIDEQVLGPDGPVDVRLGDPAEGVDVEAHRLRLAGGSTLTYDKLLIATGAAPRPFANAGAVQADPPPERSHYLRTSADATNLAAALATRGRTAIVGGGFIGCEVAAACTATGGSAVVLERTEQLLSQSVGVAVGDHIAQRLAAHGVEVLTHFDVTRVEADAGSNIVHAADGRSVDADYLVFGLGVEAQCGWLEEAGLDCDRGLLVDEFCRTSAPDVYAAGDIAVRWSPRYGRRVVLQHEATAQNHGVVAARNMVGRSTVFDDLPYVWSRFLDVDLWMVGIAASTAAPDIYTTTPGGMVAVFSSGGVIEAVVGVNCPDRLPAARHTLAGGEVSSDLLAGLTHNK